MSFVKRTISCGHVRAEHTGEQITLNGWAHKVRDLGGLLFVDLRDRTGLVQLFLDPAVFPNRGDIRPETNLGRDKVEIEKTTDIKKANDLGKQAAEELLAKGGEEIAENIRHATK